MLQLQRNYDLQIFMQERRYRKHQLEEQYSKTVDIVGEAVARWVLLQNDLGCAASQTLNEISVRHIPKLLP